MLSYYAHLGARVLCGRSSLLGLCALLCPPPRLARLEYDCAFMGTGSKTSGGQI